MPSPRHRRWIPWVAAPLVLVALALGVLLLDANILKGPLERSVASRTGRALAIGDLKLRLFPHVRFVASDVRFANPPWASQAEMLRLGKADVSIALLPLLAGRVVLTDIALTEPFIDLERKSDGDNNWTFAHEDAARGKRQGAAPVVQRLTVDRGVLLLADAILKADVKIEAETRARSDGQPGVHLHAKGQYQEQALDVEAAGGLVLSLADTREPYALEATFRIGATEGTISGTVTGLLSLAAADLNLNVKGESFSELYPLIHVALPPTPPYRVRGHLLRDGAYWRFHDFEGHVGDSDLSGSADVAYQDRRTKLTAKLESQLLDLDDLGGLIGAQPQTGPGETASARQERAKAKEEAKPNVLPDMPIKLDRLRAMDADVEFSGKSIRGRTPVDNVSSHVVLEDGVLTTKPLNFGVAGGNVVATLILDGRRDTPEVGANIEFRRISLRRLFPGNRTVERSTGIIGGRAQLKGQGNSFAELLGHADGQLGLAMSGGQVSNLVLELAGLDAQEALRLLFTGDKPVQLRCAVADLDVDGGIVKSKSTIVDTTDTNIKVDGQVDLSKEALDVTLHPLPKDYSLVVLRSPLHVRGTFKHPAVRPDKELLVRGGIAAILASVAAPLAGLVALIETGPGDDADCEHLMAAVEQTVHEKVPEAEKPTADTAR